jgi:hypothetical protein
MASLTEISLISRKVIRYSIYAIILIVIARYTISFGTVIYHKIFPPPPPKPTVAFGKLPVLPFPEKPVSDLNFTLELPDGSLPVFTDQIEVYVMPQSQPNIKALDNSKLIASKLDFDPNGKPLVESIPNVYVFPKKGYPSSLTMNIITGLFSVSYNINEDASILLDTPPGPEEAVKLAQGFISSANLFTDDLSNGTSTYEFLKIEAGNFIPAISLSDADIIKVNFFRKLYGKDGNIPPVTPKMPEANVWFYLAGGRGKQIIAGEYHYLPINHDENSTYPLKTSESAWEELKEGKGFIANEGNNPDGNIVIRRVYLGYYDAGQYSEYYQPVVVFEGDNQFYAYVPAVTDEFYSKE